MSTHRLPDTRDHATRNQLAEWLRGNGIDPNVVPIADTIQVDGGTITVPVWSLPRRVDNPARPRQYRLVQPMPAVLARATGAPA